MNITSDTTKKELKQYAAETLGAEFSDSMNRDEMIAKVKELETSLGIHQSTEGSKPGDKGEVVNTLGGPGVEAPKGKPKFMVLTIFAPPSMNTEDEESEETHCVVGFNGKNYQIEYDVAEGVQVPYGVYDILKNAVQKKYKKKKGQRELEEKNELRYKFAVRKEIY